MNLTKGTTTIFISQGAKKLIGGTISETSGTNISADPVRVAIGSEDEPPSITLAVTPDVDLPGATPSDRMVLLLVDSSTTPGDNQWLWAWITDSPEVEPIRLDGPYNIR